MACECSHLYYIYSYDYYYSDAVSTTLVAVNPTYYCRLQLYSCIRCELKSSKVSWHACGSTPSCITFDLNTRQVTRNQLINQIFHCNRISSNRLLLKIPAFITALLLTFSMPFAVASVHLAAKNVKVFLLCNAFQLPCKVSTPFFYSTVLFAMIQTSSDSSCF